MTMTKPVAKPVEPVAVRPKASQRKGRTGEITREARVPTQERSRRRYQQIIEATEALLASANIEDLSLYDIARQAQIAPASVHYLFSTVAAIHIELSRLYNRRMTDHMLARQRVLAATRQPSWQSWFRLLMREAVDLLNQHRPMAEVMLGPTMHRLSYQAAMEMNAVFARATLEMLSQAYVLPDIPHHENHHMMSIVISEALWRSAYMQNGHIDDETFEESLRATVAYMRCFLPETLRLREP